jgi:hypothetical protein
MLDQTTNALIGRPQYGRLQSEKFDHNCRRENRIPVKCPNPFLLARNLVSANSIESRSGQPSRLLNNQGSKRR